MKLLQELFAQGLLSEDRMEELKRQVEKSGKTEEDIILEKDIIPENTLFELKSKILGIPLKKVKPDEIPTDVLELMPGEAATNYKMVPLAKTENFVQIGMVYPEDISAQNALRFLASQENFTYQVYLITFSNLEGILKQRRNISIETNKALEQLEKEKGEILTLLTHKRLKGRFESPPLVFKLGIDDPCFRFNDAAARFDVVPFLDRQAF